MLEQPISSHMGIQLVQDAPLAHAWLHNQVAHDHWIHAWEPDHFMHDHTVDLRRAPNLFMHEHSISTCMSTCWSHKCHTEHTSHASASRGCSRVSVGGSHELPCPGSSWLWSQCNCPWHPKMPGPQRSPQCPITEIFKKGQQAQGEEAHGEMVEETHGGRDVSDDVRRGTCSWKEALHAWQVAPEGLWPMGDPHQNRDTLEGLWPADNPLPESSHCYS